MNEFERLLAEAPRETFQLMDGRVVTMPVIEAGGYINTLEGWNLFGAGDMEAYRKAKAEWERKERERKHLELLKEMVRCFTNSEFYGL